MWEVVFCIAGILCTLLAIWNYINGDMLNAIWFAILSVWMKLDRNTGK